VAESDRKKVAKASSLEAASAGAGGGTLLVLLANNIPDTYYLKSLLVSSLPAVFSAGLIPPYAAACCPQTPGPFGEETPIPWITITVNQEAQ
jgi:hypothetical protein